MEVLFVEICILSENLSENLCKFRLGFGGFDGNYLCSSFVYVLVRVFGR